MTDTKQRQLQVEYWDLGALVPYTANARTHSDEQVSEIAASIREFGWTNPVLVDGESGIIAGHARVEAARKLGLRQVPVIQISGLTAAQKDAYRLADNRLALNAGWDLDLLSAELERLNSEEFDVSLLGFTSEELERLITQPAVGGFTGPDDVPEPPETPVSRPGDVWVMGDHRLMCGDATDGDAVKKLLAGETPFLMVTDPPYGVSYDPEWRNRSGLAETGRRSRMANDDVFDWEPAFRHFGGDVAYVWHASRHVAEAAASLDRLEFERRAYLIWRKPQLVISRGHYHWQHEPCWYAVRRGGKARWCGDRSQSTVWDVSSRDQDMNTEHSTQKPVECMERPVRNHGKRGDLVYDPFCGSGSTLIACERQGRAFRGMDVEPKWVDVAVTRWQDYTGEVATLQGDGRSFSEVEAERLGAGVAE